MFSLDFCCHFSWLNTLSTIPREMDTNMLLKGFNHIMHFGLKATHPVDPESSHIALTGHVILVINVTLYGKLPQ